MDLITISNRKNLFRHFDNNLRQYQSLKDEEEK